MSDDIIPYDEGTVEGWSLFDKVRALRSKLVHMTGTTWRLCEVERDAVTGGITLHDIQDETIQNVDSLDEFNSPTLVLATNSPVHNRPALESDITDCLKFNFEDDQGRQKFTGDFYIPLNEQSIKDALIESNTKNQLTHHFGESQDVGNENQPRNISGLGSNELSKLSQAGMLRACYRRLNEITGVEWELYRKVKLPNGTSQLEHFPQEMLNRKTNDTSTRDQQDYVISYNDIVLKSSVPMQNPRDAQAAIQSKFKIHEKWLTNPATRASGVVELQLNLNTARSILSSNFTPRELANDFQPADLEVWPEDDGPVRHLRAVDPKALDIDVAQVYRLTQISSDNPPIQKAPDGLHRLKTILSDGIYYNQGIPLSEQMHTTLLMVDKDNNVLASANIGEPTRIRRGRRGVAERGIVNICVANPDDGGEQLVQFCQLLQRTFPEPISFDLPADKSRIADKLCEKMKAGCYYSPEDNTRLTVNIPPGRNITRGDHGSDADFGRS